MDSDDVDKLFGPKIPKRKVRVATAEGGTSQSTSSPIAKDEPEKKGRIVNLEDPDKFEKDVRPFRPFAAMFTKTYSKFWAQFDASELDAEEKAMMNTGTSAAMYEHFEAMSGTMMFMFALGSTASVRIVEIIERKRKEKELAAKQLPQIPQLAAVK